MFQRELNEECGIFAVVGNSNAASLTYYGLHALQHRGQESAGITTMKDNGDFRTHKGEGLVTEVFTDRRNLQNLTGSISIGQVRYPVTGSEGPSNIQPITLSASDEKIAIAYNGAIANAQQIKSQLEAEGSLFHASGDAEILGHIMRRKEGPFLERLKESLCHLDGAFSFAILHDSGLYIARDRFGIRPLSIGKLPDGGFVFSSETCALGIVGATFIRYVEPGEVIYIDNGRIASEFYSDERTHAMCMMEYIYFSRPDSDITGKNVHSVRKRSGIELCKESHVDADMVIGVPDSSISAANGYAEEANLPNEMGLIKNRYIGRTFIAPNQAMREQGVRMKISAIPSIVKGKRVILIDDSIVRGTTSKRIVTLLKEAGAKEVHMRISSPPIKYPCFYGVDTSKMEDLMAHQLDLDEMRRHIRADSLAFLSTEGMIKATEKPESLGDNCGHCMACFTGKYPTKLYQSIEDANNL